MTRVTAVPAFRDNYIWMIHDDRCAATVDPGDAKPVLDFLGTSKLRLTAILNTHHHADHIGGNARLLAQFDVPVYGPAHEAIAALTHRLNEGDEVSLPDLGSRFSVLDIPGHTAGHIAFYGDGRLFCGDTLFACGCGRLFEGTAAQMVDSLDKLAALPDVTQVYCGHEYTLANIRFAKHVEPDNLLLLQREAQESRKRNDGLPTLPSNIGLEKRTNPFLRCGEPALVRAAERRAARRLTDRVAVFAAVREWKDQF
jgi:hydroxyacylglutathione hydrolase